MKIKKILINHQIENTVFSYLLLSDGIGPAVLRSAPMLRQLRFIVARPLNPGRTFLPSRYGQIADNEIEAQEHANTASNNPYGG
jgi:hypothetical protein